MKYIKYLMLLVPVFLYCGCSSVFSVMERSMQYLDGSAFEEKTIANYRAFQQYGVSTNISVSIVENRLKEQSLIITVSDFPMIKLRGTLPLENGDFYFTSLEYIGGNTNGWNEYSLQLLGSGRLVPGLITTFEITEAPECIEISSGSILRYDTHITGNNALTALRNRRDRILKLSEWMLTNDAPRGMSINEFERYWKPVLFPEIVTSRNRPDNWQQDDDEFNRAEDINWNTGYTERTFSQELWSVRNSGTLLRDWEEALPWIYLEYEWENFVIMIQNKIILYKN